jgi:hypothetical protein
LDSEAADAAGRIDDQDGFSLRERECIDGSERGEPASRATPAATRSSEAGFGATWISGVSAINLPSFPHGRWERKPLVDHDQLLFTRQTPNFARF